jgi:hypothetical protein
MTRDNSGGGKSSNNRGNPTLEEHAQGHGNAISGEQKTAGSGKKRDPVSKDSSP